MAENELLNHEDYLYKQTVDANTGKTDADVFVYPSLIPMGESQVWHEHIMGHGDNTLDLGGQHSPNSVAIKQLIGRGNFLKTRQNKIIEDMSKIGGIKNLWIDGSMNIWDDGTSGDFSSTHQPRYGYGIQIMRHHSNTDANGVVTGVHGTTYHWERVIENDKNWLKMTHAGATQSGYIGQRWERNILQHLKGKTVTLSFDYKCGTDMTGRIVFYNEQDIIHDGVGMVMADKVVNYVGDNNTHRVAVTVTLATDNIVPNDTAYFGIQLGYGSGTDGVGAVPNGSIQFSNIQFEVNDKATDFEITPLAIDRLRYGRYYQRSPSWVAGQRIVGVNRVSLHHEFSPAMKSTPSVNIYALAQYNNSSTLLSVASIDGTTKQVLGTFLGSNDNLIDTAYIYKYIADARIY